MKPTPEVLQAIETAVQIEKDGLAFYTQAARQTDDPGTMNTGTMNNER